MAGLLGGSLLTASIYTLFNPTEVYASDDEEEEEEEGEDEDDLVTGQFEMDPFIVNLASGTRYMRVKIAAEYDLKLLNKIEKKAGKKSGKEPSLTPKDSKDIPALIAQKNTKIRDGIITVLGSKKANDVLPPEGKEALKTELLDKLNDAIGFDDPVITSIYFTDFIIQ